FLSASSLICGKRRTERDRSDAFVKSERQEPLCVGYRASYTRTRNCAQSSCRRMQRCRSAALHTLAGDASLREFQRGLVVAPTAAASAFLQSLRLLPLVG